MGSDDLPAEDDTFETRAQTSPLGPRRTASTAGQRPLGRATTFAPGQEQAAGRTSSTDEVVKMYKQRYSMPHMRQATFIRNFRQTANELQSQSSRHESQLTIPMDGSEEEPYTPLLSIQHTHTQSAPAFSNSPHIMHGAMYSSLIDYRARQLKEEEAFSNTLAYGRLALEITFTILAVLAAIIVAYQDDKKGLGKHAMFLGVPLLSWLILAALLCPAIRLGEWLVDGLVKLLEWIATAARLENVHYTLIGLSDALKLVASALLVECLVLIIMQERTFDLDDKHLKRINRTSLCFVVFALVELAKTLGCRLLSLRVNADSVFDLLKDTIEKERILNTIMTKSRHTAGGQSQADRYEAVSKLRSIPDWSVGQYLSNLYELSLPVDSSVVTSFTDRITELVEQFRKMTEPQLDEHATCAAEYCWLTVRKDLGRDTLLKEDLAAVLPDEEDVDVAFHLFDYDGDGYVTEPEVHSRFRFMYRQRRNLARTLRDNDDVISTLEMLMGIVMHLLAVVAYAAIFGTDVGHLLISLSSISVASAFVFGNSLKTIYESVVFLFVIRPYQVGDGIWYKDALHSVKNFGLLSTQFVRFDGRVIWVPNQTLMASDIINVTQSRNLVDRLTFEVDMDKMRPKLCEELTDRLLEMMAREQPRRLFADEFVPSSYIVGVTNPLKYTVGLTYQLAVNGETFAKVAEARTLVNHVIGTWFQDNKLTHSTSIQPLYTYGEAEKLAN